MLTDSLYFGGSRSKPIDILDDLKVVFRTLSTKDQINILEASARYRDADAKAFVRQVETIAHAVVALNGADVVLDGDDLEQLKKELGRDPTQTEKASTFFKLRVPLHIVAAIFEAYIEFRDEQFKNFDEIKKKVQERSIGITT